MGGYAVRCSPFSLPVRRIRRCCFWVVSYMLMHVRKSPSFLKSLCRSRGVSRVLKNSIREAEKRLLLGYDEKKGKILPKIYNILLSLQKIKVLARQNRAGQLHIGKRHWRFVFGNLNLGNSNLNQDKCRSGCYGYRICKPGVCRGYVMPSCTLMGVLYIHLGVSESVCSIEKAS